MSFFLLVSVVSLGSFAVISLVLSALVAVFSSCKAPERGVLRPLVMRLAPVMGGGAAAALVVSAFLAFEPWQAEAPGLFVSLLALVGFFLFAVGALRARHAVGANRRLAWDDPAPMALAGCPLPAALVDHTFPVVALVGVSAPHLVVARQVMAALEPDELRAVIGHELAHWRRRDNLIALLLRGLPDVLGFLAAGRRLEAEWAEAAEQAADAQATRGERGPRLDLASALVKVARLVPDGQVFPAAVAALHVGGPLAARVDALLTGRSAPAPRRALFLALPTAFAAVSLGALCSPAALRAAHAAIEWAVHTLR